MSLLVVGTIPFHPGELFEGPVAYKDGILTIGALAVPDCQGTAAMLMAALQVTEHFDATPPYAVLGGDIGAGDGTRAAYAALNKLLESDAEKPSVIAFHYVQPVMSLMRHAREKIQEFAPQARLVADAGGMYAARAAGLSSGFDLLTPDVGEIGFLAEPDATHPAYVANYLFGQEAFEPIKLIDEAYELGTASRVLIVKGSTDYVATASATPHITATVDKPDIPELEAIGGTGDTVAGLASGLMSVGFETEQAAIAALRINRLAGAKIVAQVYTPVREMIEAFRGTIPSCVS